MDVDTHVLTDHMESFFLAETCKYPPRILFLSFPTSSIFFMSFLSFSSFFLNVTRYLYLLFDDDNFVNQGNYIFSTEGRIQI